MVKLSVEALEKLNYKGKRYKSVKSFRSLRKAQEFADELERSACRSKRFPPVIHQIKIGLGLGYTYRVCIPKDMKVN